MRIQINALRNELAQVLYIVGFNQIMHLKTHIAGRGGTRSSMTTTVRKPFPKG